MKQTFFYNSCRAAFVGASMFLSIQHLEAQNNNISINWNKTIIISKTTPTLQLVENPMVRNSSPIHKQTFNALKELGADYVRYVPWFPYPKMAVAELKAPTSEKTYWDFTYLDSTMDAFMEATKGHSVIINFSTTPAWMWKTDSVVKYPEDPYQTCWDYNQGIQLRDTTMKELSGYFARLLSWYTKGGFTDELGKFHKSGHYYKIPYWEVLNEMEHRLSPQLYTKIYDAVVLALKKISPETKFVGLALGSPDNPEYFEYFLDPSNHEKGVPIDGISYHFYASPSEAKPSLSSLQYSYFDKADGFLKVVRYVENIRKRLAPLTFTQINEIGTFIGGGEKGTIIPGEGYWNLSGAVYAYLYLGLTKLGIDVAGESQLVGYPTQFPDVSMMDWENGKPNSRYWVLKLLKENFGPGDKLVNTHVRASGVVAQGFETKNGKKLLLINKLDKKIQLDLPEDTKDALISYVDTTTGDNPPAKEQLSDNKIELNPFSVAVIKFNK